MAALNLFTFFLLFALASVANGYITWDAPNDLEREDYKRQSRNSGDLFAQLEAINQMIHSSQQKGCRKNSEECSWDEKDEMQCCHRMTCRCTLLGGNCRCVPRMF